MGYFKENPEGEGWLYYPNGILGKGRVVSDKQYKNKLFKFHVRMYMFILPLSIIYGIGLAGAEFNLYNFIPLVIILVPIFLRQYFLVRNLPKSNIKLKYNEATSEAVKGLPMWYFYGLYTLSGISIVIGLTSPWFFNKPLSEIMELALMFIGMGVASLLLGLFLHKYKKPNKSLDRD